MTDTLTTALQQKIDEKTKPQGSLGRLEAIALQAGQVLQTTSPVLLQPHIVVFAGDHGIAATGLVNPYPQAVTAQMVLNYLNGGAAINVFCRQHGITLKVVDSGVRYHFSEWQQHPHLVHAKINQGTRNYLEESAMTAEEAIRALEKGKEIVQAIAATGCNCIGFGEMGIGNTSSASLIMSAITGLPLETCTGRGTGANDEQLAVKLRTLQQAAARHATAGTAAPALLQAFGGYEIAMMAGAYQQAAHCGMLVLVDGFIATTALLLALQQEPGIKQHCIFAHTSGEKGHEHLLHWLQVTPLLNLGLRLGEGTGAALAFPLVQAATLFVNEMASFASASVATARS